MERIRENKNREEQKAALEEYKNNAEKEAEKQKAEMQEMSFKLSNDSFFLSAMCLKQTLSCIRFLPTFSTIRNKIILCRIKL